jgi:hypothetical protein
MHCLSLCSTFTKISTRFVLCKSGPVYPLIFTVDLLYKVLHFVAALYIFRGAGPARTFTTYLAFLPSFVVYTDFPVANQYRAAFPASGTPQLVT